jgi:hypothetical protein
MKIALNYVSKIVLNCTLKTAGFLAAVLFLGATAAKAATTVLALPVVSMPEPATLTLLGAGLVAVVLKKRRRR